jgi:hypothetical protein
MASSKLWVEVEEISVTRATDTAFPLTCCFAGPWWVRSRERLALGGAVARTVVRKAAILDDAKYWPRARVGETVGSIRQTLVDPVGEAEVVNKNYYPPPAVPRAWGRDPGIM